MDSKLIISGILCLLLLISGMWLSLSGRPLNTIIFSFHKIIALAAVILLVLSVLELMKGVDMQSVQIWAVILSGIFFLLALVSGALLSFEGMVSNFTMMVHKLMPYLALVSTVIAIMLIYRIK